MKHFVLACVLLLWPGSALAQEWHVKPFVGLAFLGDTTFVDLEDAAGDRHAGFGVGVVHLGEIVGFEVDLAHTPDFFQSKELRACQIPPCPKTLVVRSGVSTFSGNVVVALPRRVAAYSLRPYFVAGGGLMRVRMDDTFGVLKLTSHLGMFDIGGGVAGFLSERFGVGWDLRYFRSVGGEDQGTGLSFGDPKLSFWRANMALVVRY